MSQFNRVIGWMIMGLIINVGVGATLKAGPPPARPEVRAIWVDAFHDGFKTPEQADKLIADCLQANLNTIIVQVRRRGDAYYNASSEPRTEDPLLPAGFDALQYLIDKAHANRLEVHAWLTTLVAWNKKTPPQDPNHVWNRHGPGATGDNDWIAYSRVYDTVNRSWSDQLCSSYFLDPGNPAALDYTVDIYLNIVKNYQVDGIHLDYSRYDGLGWGYNGTNVARYNTRYGTSGLPEPDDPRWMQWRREQTANLVRKVYLKAIALRPELKVSSAVVTWGAGPISTADWEQTRAYTVAGQDWRSWLEEGILDLAVPMNYFCEWKSTHQSWYDRWIEWEKDHQYDRQIVIGPGVFLQYPEQSLAQIRRAGTPSAHGNYAAGVALFAYGWNNLYSNDSYQEGGSKYLPRQPHIYIPETNDWLFPLLSQKHDYYDPVLKRVINTEPVFPTPVSVPDMSWKTRPTYGYLMGTLTGSVPKSYDGVKVMVSTVNSGCVKFYREVVTDGSGWYGLAKLAPGQYQVRVNHSDFEGTPPQEITVRPGRVVKVDFIAHRP
jgi:uncharacterized lipoprotein YddW (UPF0748 family)